MTNEILTSFLLRIGAMRVLMIHPFIFYFDAQTYEATSSRAMHWMLIIETGFRHGVVIC